MAVDGAVNNIIFKFVLRMGDEWRGPWHGWPRRQVDMAGAMGTALGRGIAPDVHIPWTPARLVRDAELETACERVAG